MWYRNIVVIQGGRHLRPRQPEIYGPRHSQTVSYLVFGTNGRIISSHLFFPDENYKFVDFLHPWLGREWLCTFFFSKTGF